MGYIAFWSFKYGDMERLLAPVDDDGHFCGVDEGYEDHQFVYWPDLTDKTSIFSTYVCVSECPQYKNGDDYDCVPTLDWPRCESKISYNSFKYLGRICVPNYEDTGNDLTQQILHDSYLMIQENL